MILRPPSDVMLAYHEWQASCGPAALAAVLGVEVQDTRIRVTGTSTGILKKSFMNARHMRHAIGHRLGETWTPSDKSLLERVGVPRVVLLQWCGSWESVPRAAATYRHWIANAVYDGGPKIYDVNSDEVLTLEQWERELVPQLMPKRGTGWRIAWAAEVKDPVRPSPWEPERALLGCCRDRPYGKGCTTETCMHLPVLGQTCSDCVHVMRCTTIFGQEPDDIACQFFPRRFRPAKDAST